MEKWPGGGDNGSRKDQIRPRVQGIRAREASTDKQGIEHIQFVCEPGSYQAQIGFRAFGRFESDWFSAATDNLDAQERPLQIDIHHPDVVRFANKLFSGLTLTPDDPRFMSELDKRYSSLLPSAPLSKFEHYNGLSDIVHEGSGTCAAKTTLLGILLSRRYPRIHLQEIYGQVGAIRDRVSYPFGHEWLRAEGDKYIFLYDAMYSRTAAFEKQGNQLVPVDDGYKMFENYSVEAWPVTALYSKLQFSSMSGNVKLVDAYDRESQKFFLFQDAGFDAQVDGTTHFAFDLRQQRSLELLNGHLQTIGSKGAAVYYPVISIVRHD